MIVVISRNLRFKTKGPTRITTVPLEPTEPFKPLLGCYINLFWGVLLTSIEVSFKPLQRCPLNLHFWFLRIYGTDNNGNYYNLTLFQIEIFKVLKGYPFLQLFK